MNQENDSTTKPERESQTIAELLDDDRVPVGIRHWLEQYRETGNEALSVFNANRDSGTMEQARLIYDILDSKHQETGTNEFSEAARDLIEEYVYQLAEASDIQVWNQPDLAVLALPYLLDCATSGSDVDPTTSALRLAIEALTTRRERRAFLRDFETQADETKEDRDWKAARKLSRYLASPTTDPKVRRELGAAICQLANATDVQVDHPALIMRAASIMFENVRTAEARREYGHILAVLDELPELPKAGDE